jgi:hypothetical protein
MPAPENSPVQPALASGAAPASSAPVGRSPSTDGAEAASARCGASDRLFSGVTLRTPLEELKAVFEKKARGLESSASHEQLERMRRAYEIARERLAATLEAGS